MTYHYSFTDANIRIAGTTWHNSGKTIALKYKYNIINISANDLVLKGGNLELVKENLCPQRSSSISDLGLLNASGSWFSFLNSTS